MRMIPSSLLVLMALCLLLQTSSAARILVSKKAKTAKTADMQLDMAKDLLTLKMIHCCCMCRPKIEEGHVNKLSASWTKAAYTDIPGTDEISGDDQCHKHCELNKATVCPGVLRSNIAQPGKKEGFAVNDAITNRVCQRTAHSLFPDEISDAPLEDGEEEVFDHTSVTSPSKSSKSKSSQSASSSDSNGSEISSVSGSDVDSVSETDSISETDSVFSTGTQDHVSDVVGEVATSVETAVSELEKEIMDDNKEGDDSDLDTAPIPSRSTSTSSTSSTAPKASHSAAASECCCLCKAPSTLHYDPYALWVPTERTKMDRNAKPLSTSTPSLNTIICNEYCTRQSKRVEVCPKVVRNEGKRTEKKVGRYAYEGQVNSPGADNLTCDQQYMHRKH